MSAATQDARAYVHYRAGWPDLALAVVAAVVFFAAGQYLQLATTVVIMAIFGLSLDLALGFGGIVSLGHAAFFGFGAYAAGLYALHISSEPITGLVAGGVAAGLFGLVSGVVILRTRGLTLIMMTLALAAMVTEFANVAKDITGGDDGLTGYTIAPILGRFAFDLYGRTAYLYGVAVLFVVFWLVRMVVNSPFGLTMRGIRDNAERMQFLGVPVRARLVMLYGLAAALAGVAGGLSAQVTGLVGIEDTLSFVVSGNVLILLILGGAGRLYGALVGAALFVVVSDRAAAYFPANWLFILGGMLILVVRFAPDGLIAAGERLLRQR